VKRHSVPKYNAKKCGWDFKAWKWAVIKTLLAFIKNTNGCFGFFENVSWLKQGCQMAYFHTENPNFGT
jgi:hypothetical protein